MSNVLVFVTRLLDILTDCISCVTPVPVSSFREFNWICEAMLLFENIALTLPHLFKAHSVLPFSLNSLNRDIKLTGSVLKSSLSFLKIGTVLATLLLFAIKMRTFSCFK